MSLSDNQGRIWEILETGRRKTRNDLIWSLDDGICTEKGYSWEGFGREISWNWRDIGSGIELTRKDIGYKLSLSVLS